MNKNCNIILMGLIILVLTVGGCERGRKPLAERPATLDTPDYTVSANPVPTDK